MNSFVQAKETVVKTTMDSPGLKRNVTLPEKKEAGFTHVCRKENGGEFTSICKKNLSLQGGISRQFS